MLILSYWLAKEGGRPSWWPIDTWARNPFSLILTLGKLMIAWNYLSLKQFWVLGFGLLKAIETCFHMHLLVFLENFEFWILVNFCLSYRDLFSYASSCLFIKFSKLEKVGLFRPIRQGCSLALELYIMEIEVPGYMLHWIILEGPIKGISFMETNCCLTY